MYEGTFLNGALHGSGAVGPCFDAVMRTLLLPLPALQVWHRALPARLVRRGVRGGASGTNTPVPSECVVGPASIVDRAKRLACGHSGA